jgi:uncharacterized protein YciI
MSALRFLSIALFVTVGAAVPVVAQRYCYVILNTNPDRKVLPEEEVKKLMEGHLANIDRLAEEGKLLVAGPFEGGGGVFIMNSGDTVAVREWLATDPGIRAERWKLEVFPFEPVAGRVCRGQSDARMVTYTWVRFRQASIPSEIADAHRRYINDLFKKGEVISEGTFSNARGSILVLRSDSVELINNDPLVQHGVPHNVKKWWVAEGSFCE